MYALALSGQFLTSDLETLFLDKKRFFRSLVKMQPPVENHYLLVQPPAGPGLVEALDDRHYDQMEMKNINQCRLET